MSAGSELGTRIVVGMALAAVGIGAMWLGGYAFWLLVSAMGLAMMAEWAGLMKASRGRVIVAVLLLAVTLLLGKAATQGLALPLAPGLDPPQLLWVALLVPAALAILMCGARTGAGLLYVGLPALGLVYLRAEPAGLALALWTLFVVAATDTGAYFAGRAIGGPKLAPALSPSKTWAGLGGGMVVAVLVGALIAHLGRLPAPFFWLGAPMAVMAQVGDLFESWLKRRAGVKDSGTLLPGHGGAMDRFDGAVPVATLTALLVLSGFAR